MRQGCSRRSPLAFFKVATIEPLDVGELDSSVQSFLDHERPQLKQLLVFEPPDIAV